MRNSNCKKFRKLVSRRIGGDLSVSQRAAAEKHLADCGPCRGLERELQQLGALYRQVVDQEARTGGFRSIRSQLEPLLAGSPRRPFHWWQTVPVAGMLAMAGFLLLSGGFHARKAGELPEKVSTATLWMSPAEDTSDVILTIENPGPEPHQVAVSRRSNDFRQARTFKIKGGQGLDPMPVPGPGEVYFYRMD